MSHIEIKLVADTASDLSALVAGLHQQLTGDVVIGRIEADVTDHVGNDPALETAKKPVRASSAAKTTEAIPAGSVAATTGGTTTSIAPAAADEGNAGTKSTTTASGAGASADTPALVYKDVQDATNALVVKKGRDAALEVLGTFGAKKGQDLTEDQWSAYIEACSLAQEG